MAIVKWVANLLTTVAASVILILLGIVYFMITVWMIKIGASWAGFPGLSGDWVVLTAGIVTAAAIIGSAIQK